MNPETETISFASTPAQRPGAHERQQFPLPALGITVDKYGWAHDAATGRYMKGKLLSQANVHAMDLWQDYIVENVPVTQEQRISFFDEVFEAQAAAEVPESVGLRQRVRRLFHRASYEMQHLPQTGLDVVRTRLGRLAMKAESSPRRNILVPVMAQALVAVSVLGTAGRVYASTKYGVGGGSFESHSQFGDFVNQQIGGGAVHGSGSGGSGIKQEVIATVAQHKHHVSSASQHEVASTLNLVPGSTTSDSQPTFTNGTLHHDTITHLNSTGKHKQEQLNLEPGHVHGTHVPHNPHGPHAPNGPEHNPNGHNEVFLSRDFVEHGNGITQEYVDIAQAHGINLSGEEAYRAYNYVNAHVHGNFFMDDPMYRLPNGDWGISHPGWAHWTNEERFWFHHWLIENDKLSKK